MAGTVNGGYDTPPFFINKSELNENTENLPPRRYETRIVVKTVHRCEE